MKTTLIFLISIFFFNLQSFGSTLEIAQSVLENLYWSNGNFIFQKPILEITDDEENAALYMRRANKIEISRKAMKVCRSFGRDSLDALAFLIGHELAHSYKSELIHSETSFLAYDKHHDSKGKKIEEDADLHGLFMTWLAGYNSQEIAAQLIDRIYVEFDLKDKKLKNYPTLPERQKSTQKMVALTEELIQLFEAGNHLLVIGNYELAAACFEHVEQYYNAGEVYNNLGICYALSALNGSKKNIEPFIFPFEINWHTRFEKPKGSRGVNDLNEEDQAQRSKFLEKAANYFSLAFQMAPQASEAGLNLFCTMSLQDKNAEALDFYKKNNFKKAAEYSQNPSFSKEKVRLAFAGALYHIERTVAIRIWKNLIKSEHSSIAQRAIHNFRAANGLSISEFSEENCGNLSKLNVTVEGIKLHRPSGSFKPLAGTKELEFSILEKGNSLVYFFKKNGRFSFSLQRIFAMPNLPNLPDMAGIYTQSGFVSVCEENRISLLMKGKQVKEWAKYFRGQEQN